MSSCKGCGVSEERDFCDLCDVLIPAIGGTSLHLVPKDNEMNSAVSRIGLKSCLLYTSPSPRDS